MSESPAVTFVDQVASLAICHGDNSICGLIRKGEYLRRIAADLEMVQLT